MKSLQNAIKESLRIKICDEVKISVCESLRIGINDKPEDEISLIKGLQEEIDENELGKGALKNKFTNRKDFEEELFSEIRWRNKDLLKHEHDVKRLNAFIDELCEEYGKIYEIDNICPRKWMNERLNEGIHYLDNITSIKWSEIIWGRFDDGYLLEIKDEKRSDDLLFIGTAENIENLLK